MPGLCLPDQATVLVTGASQGIGRSLALEWAKRGHDVILTARSETMLQGVAEEVTMMGQKAHVFPADLSAPEGVQSLIEQVETAGLQVDVLVNNAGYGMMRSFETTEPDDVAGMIDLNIRALSALSRHYLPGMLERKRGGILNVASIAGFAPGPYMAVYFATKNFVLSLSEALHHECRTRGVVVTALCPGPVRTGFGKRSGISEDQFQQAPGIVTAEMTARSGIKAFIEGKRVIVPGWINKLAVLILKALPHGLILRLMGWTQSQIKRD